MTKSGNSSLHDVVAQAKQTVDPIDDLIPRLEPFHIGSSCRVVGSPEMQSRQKTLNSDANIVESEDGATSSDDDGRRPGTALVVAVVVGSLPAAVALPQFIEDDFGSLVVAAHERNRMLPIRMTLPRPKTGCRPCWEPPILEYSLYDDLIQAHDAVTAKEGNKDITWRTEFLDIMLEDNLLLEYSEWVEEMRDEAEDTSNKAEMSFYKALFMEVKRDLNVVHKEGDYVELKNKDGYEKYSRSITKEFNAIRIAPGSVTLVRAGDRILGFSTNVWTMFEKSKSGHVEVWDPWHYRVRLEFGKFDHKGRSLA